MNSFDIKTKIYFGDQALDRLAEIPYERILLITDPFMAESSMFSLVTDPLKKGGKQFEVFKDVVPDPPIEKISLGVDKMLAYKPAAIVAVGGGSAIDSSNGANSSVVFACSSSRTVIWITGSSSSSTS